MKTKYFFLAAIGAMTLASCSNDELVGDNSPTLGQEGDGSIQFTYTMPNATRADIYGDAAATLLGKAFYVTGTKGTEAADSPTPTLVFDNYLVHYGANTAGTTESNTANWEYVGVTPGTGDYTNWVKLGTASPQTIKYWDYSTEQYDFHAFSTGAYKAVSKTTYTGGSALGEEEIGVTASLFGAGLASSATAYTFYLPNVNALKQAYVTDIIEVPQSNYGRDVVLKFKSLGSKVRIALYETVPGYSVKNVQFYQWDHATDITTGEGKVKGTTAALISGNSNGLPTNGTIQVIFPSVGNSNAGKQDYDKVAGHVTPIAIAEGGTYEKYKGFGTLSNYAGKEINEDDGSYLGRTLPNATFAGKSDADYYETVFPVSSGDPLTLRVDYTLVATDGSDEEIKVYGAKAVVPSTYINWLPNYAYTYIFKISDNTNGWTSTATTTDPAGLFPITFDAVVTEATDATGKQTTITTVSTPSITTYQQNHDPLKPQNEYSKATGKNVYVQVMNNDGVAPATLVTSLSNTNSLLYQVPSHGKSYSAEPVGWPAGFYTDAACTTAASGSFATGTTYYRLATEAEVMDALQNRTTELAVADVTGRNGVTLTKNSNITITDSGEGAVAGKFRIKNGADDKPIVVNQGEASEITISSLDNGTYAYVYDYTTGDKTTVNEYQPFTPAGATIAAGYKKITTATLGAPDGTNVILTTSEETITDELIKDYIYFSKTTNGTGTTTYSYISIVGKKGQTLPAGVIKVKKTYLGSTSADESVSLSDTFYFDHYISNNGKYAVKIIKIVA